MSQEHLQHNNHSHPFRYSLPVIVSLSSLLLMSLCFMSACSEVESLEDEESTEKNFGNESYYDDPYGYYEDDQEQFFNADDEEIIDQFLSTLSISFYLTT